MTARFSFRVAGWAGWSDGVDALQIGGAAEMPGGLPLSVRRRVSPVGRRALEAAMAVLPAAVSAGCDQPRIILASRHGEYGRSFRLLNELVDSGEVSPADFSMAVHHGLAGLLSIQTGNRAGHSAIAAGPDTAGFALLEAAACLSERPDPVLVICFDEPLPGIYEPVASGQEAACVLALVLLSADADSGELIHTDMVPADGMAATGELAASLLSLLATGARSAQASGPRMSWSWNRAEPA